MSQPVFVHGIEMIERDAAPRIVLLPGMTLRGHGQITRVVYHEEYAHSGMWVRDLTRTQPNYLSQHEVDQALSALDPTTPI